MTDVNSFLRHLPAKLTEAIAIMGVKDLQEIRIAAEKNCILQKGGRLCDSGVNVGAEELSKILESMCRGSLYAMQTSLCKGYLTLGGGHRVGVCGRVVTENGEIVHMTDISAICIRIAREIKGAADEIMEYLECDGKLYNTLIISPPGCGKTTVLRDVARQLGNRHKVCIADERSEIAACRGRIPTADVGKFTCVMDGVPKAEGIEMLLRTMSPEVIVTDETGGEEEARAISHLINCGAKIITTAHGYSERDVSKKPHIGPLIDRGIFERIVVLSNRKGVATVEKIITDGRVIRRVEADRGGGGNTFIGTYRNNKV